MTIEDEINYFHFLFSAVLQLDHIYNELLAGLVCPPETIPILSFRIKRLTSLNLGIYTSKKNKTMTIFVFFLNVHS